MTGAACLSLLQTSTVPTVRQLYVYEDMWYKHDGALPRYLGNVRAYLDVFPDKLIGRTGPVEYPRDHLYLLNPPEVFLWGYLKEAVYSIKPVTLQELRQETEVLHSRPNSNFGDNLSVSYPLLSTVPRS
jgi:hypothetical protein